MDGNGRWGSALAAVTVSKGTVRAKAVRRIVALPMAWAFALSLYAFSEQD